MESLSPEMTVLGKVIRAVGEKTRELAARIPSGQHECVICGRKLAFFLPYRQGSKGRPPLMGALEIVGSDVDNFSCPWCHSHDRERHLYLLMKAAGLFDYIKGRKVLHFAPERHLSSLIREAGPAEYVACDRYPWTTDIQEIDIAAMPFPDGYFDLVLANHVLEHVEDDRQAVREIARVLAPGGRAILQTPYSPMLEKTWEDSGIRLPEARRQAFGQEDHVRLFGRDIFARFAQSGLEPQIQTHGALLHGYSAKRLGVNPDEPLFLFAKPALREKRE